MPPVHTGGTPVNSGAFVFEVPSTYDGATVWAFLKGYCRMSSALIRSVKFVSGGITVGGQNAHTDRILHTGEVVSITEREDNSDLAAFDMPLTVLYESSNVVVFDKPAGIVVHPTLGYPGQTLANAFAAWCKTKGLALDFRPVFRIDKDTTGCLAVAKSRYAAAALNGAIAKQYICVAEGIFDKKSGRLDGPIGLEDGSFIKRCVRADGKPSITDYWVEREFDGRTVLRVSIETGRTHQIRVHMADAGHPLCGDTFYGGSSRLIGRQALHCERLFFADEGEQHCVVSPVPDDIKRICE